MKVDSQWIFRIFAYDLPHIPGVLCLRHVTTDMLLAPKAPQCLKVAHSGSKTVSHHHLSLGMTDLKTGFKPTFVAHAILLGCQEK